MLNYGLEGTKARAMLSGNYGSKLLFFIALNALAPLNHNHRLNLNLNYNIPCKSCMGEICGAIA